MKSTVSALTIAASIVLALPALAQEEVRKETVRETSRDTTVTGTINEFGENRIILRSETANAPTTYSFSKTTTYVDEAGAPVSREIIKSGLPVTIHYVKEGDGYVANRVVVKKTKTRVAGDKTETAETKTVTKGTINEFGDNRIVIKSETAAEPLRYSYTKSTTYVDEAGNPVSMELVKSGLPVSVYYTKGESGPVATKVVVRKTTTKVKER